MKSAIISLCLSFVIFIHVDAEWDCHGYLDTYHAYQISDDHEWLSSRSRLRIEPAYFSRNLSIKSIVDFEYNEIQDSVDVLTLHELYLDVFGENWDIRIGRQIVIWGKTEGLQVLDVISPWDMTEFLARDFDDLRLGVDAIRFRYMQNDWTLEAVCLPRFQSSVRARKDTPWYIPSPEMIKGLSVNAENPAVNFKNIEYGIRLSKYQSWGDWSFVFLQTWSDTSLPVKLDRSPLEIIEFSADYQRLNVVGTAFSIPLNTVMLRGEIAWYDGYRLLNKNPNWHMQSDQQQLKWVMGVDWNPGGAWLLSVQLTDSQLLDYQQGFLIPEHTRMLTFSVSKSLFRETLKCAIFSFVGLAENDTFTRLSFDYSYSDALHFLTGLDLFTGKKGMLGYFNSNDEFWVKLKYSF